MRLPIRNTRVALRFVLALSVLVVLTLLGRSWDGGPAGGIDGTATAGAIEEFGPVGGPGYLDCTDTIDNDFDGFIDWLDPGCTPDHTSPLDFPAPVDTDGDGSIDDFEVLIGTAPLIFCEAFRPFGAIPSATWPHDLHGGAVVLDSRNLITAQDMIALLAPVRTLDTSPVDPAFDSRHDLLPGKIMFLSDWINAQDFGSFLAPVRFLDGPDPCP